jgi:hypothetical protein
VFCRLTTYPQRIFGNWPRFSTDFNLMIAKKGPFSFFGVFNFQRLTETFLVQSWCAAVVNLKNQRLFSKKPVSLMRFQSTLNP